MTIGLKQHAGLLLTLTMLGMGGAAPVCAQQLAASFGAPWMEDETESIPAPRAKAIPDTEEIEVRPLSLADLQNIAEGDRISFKPAGKATPIEDMYSDRACLFHRFYGRFPVP